MFIYVSGPYQAASTEGIAANVQDANCIAMAITQKGHIPFIPHTMMAGWEGNGFVSRERILDICLKWVDKCDALYFIETSDGAEKERIAARQRGIPIYRNLDDVPEVVDVAPPPGSDSPQTGFSMPSLLPESVIQCYLTEYQECMDSYRHTYATIWQAGSVCAVIAAGLITIVGKTAGGGIPWWVQVSVPALILVWWWCIYRPMNHYAEMRSDRLGVIESILNCALPRLEMRHFSDYNAERKGRFSVRLMLRRLWWLRVSYGVTFLCLLLVVVEVLLVIKHHHVLFSVMKKLFIVNQ